MIRILHLTDPHLFANAEGSLRGTATQASLQRVIDHYQAGDWSADRVIITGDLIQDDTAEAYERFRELLLPLNMRMHCVPGNHDIRDLMRPICCAPPFSYCAHEEIGDWLLIGLDSCVRGDAGGLLTEEELERLTTTVTQSAAKHVMVCLHHPPVKMGSAWLDTVGLRNGDEFLDRLQSLTKVRLAVFGHVHQDYDLEHKGIRIIATPSTCRQFLPGSDDFAVDSRPPAYRRITLHNDGSSEAELIWVDE
ncbi:MAG: metallophosphoesterase [Gammaproteobacteria bacterium]|nr:metallophosphoesterase [Gammaproteobacteria bacterium]MBU2678278.1 metallophosphoesterase [Gammaproteobacteria bacterium]NNL52013.1 phosphodiesterase [Woeseiaceae bacterium]